MITNVNKKVICVKDIPSNVIEEAIFILKSDVSISKNESRNMKRKEIITQEADDFLKNYLNMLEIEEKNAKSKINKNKQLIQIVLLFSIIMIGAICIYFVICNS